jgi:DNA adenine methylase
VKWVWWKRQLISQFEKLFPKQFNNYFEPFLWWWAVFFNLQKEKSYLSDINAELINTYQIIKNNPIELVAFLKTLKYSKEYYLEIRSWDRKINWQNKYSIIQRAWRFIYLNRTCFNWLYRVNSNGQFNVPMWKYTNPNFIQEENILNTSKLLNKTKAEIKLQSFEKVLNNVEIWDFVYFDPPYDVLSDSANFTSYDKSGFWQDMQKKLSEVFRELDRKWCYVMLSNHNTPFIRDLYKWFRFEIVKARRSINSKGTWRGQVDEIVFMNY